MSRHFSLLRIFFLFFVTAICFGTANDALAQKRGRKVVKVACVGNSITYGMGIADRAHDSYPAQLQRMLGEGYEVGNFGKSGATLLRKGYRPYMAQPEFRQALDFAGDIAVIHLGINDTDPRAWPNYGDEFVADYLALMDSLRAVNPNVRFILARMTPIGNGHHRFDSGTKEWHGQIQRAIETVADVSGAELIDFYEPLNTLQNLIPDNLHPNPEGAGILARIVYGGITGDYGGLRLPRVYTDNMVLQRRQPISFEGTANAGDKVSVRLGKVKGEAVASNRGKWQITLPAQEAAEDLTLIFECAGEKKTFRNVAIGEVWLCSGQSNMEFTLNRARTGKEDIPRADDPALRFFDMKARWLTNDYAWPLEALDSVNHLKYFEPSTAWEAATPASAARFSAVAYYFGRALRDSLGVPVGLICNAVGGSPTESWIDRETLETRFPAILRGWLTNDFVQPWVRDRGRSNISNDSTLRSRHPYQAAYLFESGILPLAHYGVRGFVWYQGESNAHNVEAHERLFPLLVESWRNHFGGGKEKPFLFVQLSSLNRPSWPAFRDSQRRLIGSLENVGMAVTSDVGDSLDVHPVRKREVGERLARWALSDTYGHNVTPSGPLAKTARRGADGTVEVLFDFGKTLSTSDGLAPRTFEVAEYEGCFRPAEAEIVDGTTVRLRCSDVKTPRFVRYGWQPFTRANLVGTDGLPASTFKISVDE